MLLKTLFRLALCGVALWIAPRVAALPLAFDPPVPEMANLDRDGTLLVIHDVRMADFGRGLRLPVRLVYRSADQSSNPYGWAGFSLTLLEAKAVKRTSSLIEVTMLSGRVEYFSKGVGEESEIWRNNSKQWTGVESEGGTKFLITRWDGWKMEFINGRIKKLVTEDKRLLIWGYDSLDSALATSVKEVGRDPVITVGISDDPLEMDGSSTLRGAHTLTVNGDTYTFRYEDETLRSMEFPDGRKIQWRFEPHGEEEDATRLTLTEAGGRWKSWVFCDNNRKVKADDAWTYTLTGGEPAADGVVYNRPTMERTRIATGECEKWQYTAANSIHTIRDALGNERAIYSYKTPGKLYDSVYKIERKRAGESGFTTIWRGAYDAATGDLLRSYDAADNETVFTTERFSGASEFQPPKKVTITDALGRTRSLERDLRGDVIEVVNAAGVKRKLEYDRRHRLKRIKNGNNDLLARLIYGEQDQVLEIYDASQNKTSFEYDLHLGETLLKKMTTPEGRVRIFTRDAKGRMVQLRTPATAEWEFAYVGDGEALESVLDPLDQETSYAYDARLNRIRRTDALSRTIESVYDDLDLPAEVTDALNHVTAIQNNAHGDMVKLTDARSKEYTQVWESGGTRKSLDWPDGGAQTSTFDTNGNLAQWKSRGDFATVSIARNAAQEISGVTWTAGAESGSTSFTRNAAGQVTGASASTMSLSVDQSMSYDAEGRLATLGQTVGAVTRTTGVTYDLEGRVSTLTYPAGFAVSYDYNKDGQIETIRLGSTTLASYAYDAGGRLATRTLSNGVMTSYTYDGAERLDSITVSKSGTVLWAERYGYNADGERIHTLRGTTGTLGDAYWLDAASQLRGVKYGVADATGAYAGITAGTYSEWSYDAAGNRLQETGSAGMVNYTANAINQYTAITGTGTLGYSARGDLTQVGNWTLTYDAYGNLLRAHNTDTDALAKYWRDATGRRAVKDVDGSKTVFFNLGTDQLEAYDVTADTVSSTIYGLGIDRPLAEVSDDGTVTFYHQDWLGSVVLLTDESGAKVQSYTYDAWGVPSGFDASDISIPISSISSRFLYTGREYDQETSLYHYRARAYAPTFGRFLQPDPIDFSGGDGNLFRYVFNNPINWVDPFGLETAVQIGMGTGIKGNPFGHAAAATSGQGVHSFGTGTPRGSCFSDYMNSQAAYRDSMVYVLPTTPEQEKAINDYLNDLPDELPHVPGKDSSDNCASRVNEALKEAGLDVGENGTPAELQRALEKMVKDSNALHFSVPKGSTPSEAWQTFDPK